MEYSGQENTKRNETKKLKLEHTMRGRNILVAICYFGFVRYQHIHCAVDFRSNYRNRCNSFVTSGILHTKTLRRNQINIFISKVTLLNHELVYRQTFRFVHSH